MGARGPKKGFKLAKVEGAATPLSSIQTTKPAKPAKATPSAGIVASAPMSAADLENPNKLEGAALRELAHKRGLSRSELEDMPDAKIRLQLLYVTNRQYMREFEGEAA